MYDQLRAEWPPYCEGKQDESKAVYMVTVTKGEEDMKYIRNDEVRDEDKE